MPPQASSDDAQPAPKRFVRSVYDVDRSRPSPLRWVPWPTRPRSYVRRMGLVESFFSTMGSLHHGRTDIFQRIRITFPPSACDHLLDRLPLVYAILCRRHPLLSSHVAELTPDLEPFDQERARSLRQAGSADGSPSALSEPHFVYELPPTAEELLTSAAQRVLFLPEDWSGSLGDAEHNNEQEGAFYQDSVTRWLKQYVWNGPRRFLRQDSPYGLGRLVVLPGESPQSIDLVLCVAHCVGDGLSVSALMAELVNLLTSADLPASIPGVLQVSADEVLAGATRKQYRDVGGEVKRALVTGLLADFTREGQVGAILARDVEPLLPPSIEAAYPPLVAALPPSHRDVCPSLARKRWFWALRRVRAQVQSALSLNNYLTNFAAQHFPGSDRRSLQRGEQEQDWGAATDWSVLRLGLKETEVIVAQAKSKGVRIGALLYAISACALNQLEKEHEERLGILEANEAVLRRQGLAKRTVIGFPFSIRQYLEPESTVFEPRDGGAIVEGEASAAANAALRPSPLSVQLGFGGIWFPAPDAFSLSSSSAHTTRLGERDALRIWRMAKHAQSQLDALFRYPTNTMADGFINALDRENRFRVQGASDIFSNPPSCKGEAEQEEGGEKKGDEGVEDEHRSGHVKRNMQGPGSSLNFSMLGSIDRLFGQMRFNLPLNLASGGGGGEEWVEVDAAMTVGVRCREGEAFGTAFTFGGRLTLELGHDTNTWSTGEVERYLGAMRNVLLGLTA
ncbi:hypothetical protein ACQY0O_008350 [Thecaphora frezii]